MEFYAWFVKFKVSLPVHGDSARRDDSSQQGLQQSAVNIPHQRPATVPFTCWSRIYLPKDKSGVYNEMVVLNRS